MSTETLALIIVWAAAPAATLVPIIYGITASWWRSLTGRALMTSAVGLALLIDLSLIFRAWDGHLQTKREIALVIYVLICAGSWLMLLALVRAQLRSRR